MKINAIHEVTRHCNIITGTKWNERERGIQQSAGGQHCFYCNFSLKCGQQDCIWRENYA